MKKTLLKSKILAAFLFFAVSYTSVKAQCSITTTTNASVAKCGGTAPLSSCSGIVYIGDGTNTMSLLMNSDFDLTCLGAIQFIVRNKATLDFDAGSNKNLILAAGSSIVFESGSAIKSVGSCSGSDLISIGGISVANCNGSNMPSFAQIVANGGINAAGILSGNQYICTYGTNTTTFSSTFSGGTWSSGSPSIATVNPSTGVVTAAGVGTATITYTKSGVTATRNVYVAGGPGGGVSSINGSTLQCQNSNTTYTLTSELSNFAHTWSYDGLGATISPSADGRSATITFASNATSGNIRVGASNACGTDSGNKTLYVTISATSSGGATTVNGSPASSISGCTNSYVANIGLSGYVGTPVRWETSIDNFGSIASTIVGNSNNINAVNLTQTTYFRAVVQNSPCSIAYSNICAVIISSTPPAAAVGSITGTSTVCQGQTGVIYSVGAVTGATGYNWNLPSGATIVSGTNTNAITVNYSSSASSGNITVQATNGCGAGSSSANYPVTVNSLPSTPGTITGTAAVCQGQANVAYSVSTITNATSYNWTYSGSGATIANGTTRTPTVTFASNATSGNLTVYGINSCGNGAVSSNYAIAVNIPVVAAGTIAGSPSVCQGQSGVAYSVPIITNATSYTWAFSGVGATFTNGTTRTPTITFASNATSGNLTVRGVNACGNGTISANYGITINPLPDAAGTITGTATVCQGQSNVAYSVGSITNATSYAWSYSGTGATFTNGTTRTPSITFASNATSGNLTVYGVNACGNGVISANYGVTVNPLPIAAGTITGTAAVCQGQSNVGYSVGSITNATSYTWSYSGTGATITGTTNTPTITFAANATSGNLTVYGVNACGNGTISTNYAITVNPIPSTPTFGTITNPTCAVSTGSVVLNNLPSGNWTLYNNGTLVTTGSGTTYTLSGLAAGTYNFTVSSGTCTSGLSLPLNIQAGNTWDGIKWSKTGDATLPTAGDKIIFEGNYTLASDLTGCSCTVNSGNVIVNSGITLTITNAVIVNGGTLTFENNASLLQDVNTIVNNNFGPITYKRNSQPMKNFDYTYWSSPVEGQTFVGLSPNTLWDKYLSFTGTIWKEELGSSIMQPGIGYIIRVPKPNSVYPNGKDYWTGTYYTQIVEFIGKPNNGNITNSQYMEKDKFYLIGNPYPSAIHADDFLYENVHNRDILGGTVYFWTHNTAIKIVNSRLAYVSDDYASYNLTGGTATRAALSPGVNTEIPLGYIAAGQSFFTSAEDGSGNVEFTNAMRYGGTHNGQFFKPGKTSKSAVMEKHRLWLNMTNSGGAYKQTLIGYIEGATNAYDKNFDGLSYDGNSYIDFYSINTADNLAIQGRALPFTDTDVVPLGYRSTLAGNFTIAIDQADGNLATQRVYLEDKQTNTINELTAKNYTFTTKAGTFNNRFVLRYTNKTLGTGDFESVEDVVSVVIQNKTVTVNSTVENIDKVLIYDVSGKFLYQKENVNNLQLIIQNLPFAQQVLLVKVVLDNGYQTTKKVIFK